MVIRGRLARIMAAIAVSVLPGCVTNLAPHDAMLSTGPDAPGYMIVGLAEQNSRCELGAATQAVALRFAAENGKPVVAGRSACGLVSSGREVERVVLQAAAGRYRPDFATEVQQVFVTKSLLKDDVHNAEPVEVPAGGIVYAGDYIFRSDFGVDQEIKLVRIDHDAVGAAAALKSYPNLVGAPFVSAGGLRVAQ